LLALALTEGEDAPTQTARIRLSPTRTPARVATEDSGGLFFFATAEGEEEEGAGAGAGDGEKVGTLGSKEATKLDNVS
jgi:hypothetical protein